MATPENWIVIQTRVFTNWVNNVLARHYKDQAPVVQNLSTDLRSGVILMKLFEALFSSRGLKIPHYNPAAATKPQWLDNVTQALSVLPSVGVMTVFITPLQVVEGELKMILGLIWRLILATQVVALGGQKPVLGGDETQIDGGAKMALLDWCRKRLANYPSLSVDNFTTSWQNGMAFIGLLHSQNPNLINFDMLDPNRAADNLGLAFEMAFHEFGIPKLLQPGDLLNGKPDERCIMTYVSEYAYRFDILGKPVADDRARLLDQREQQLALREAQLEKEAAERLAMATNLGQEAQRIHADASLRAEQLEKERIRLQQEEAANAQSIQLAQMELARRKAELDAQTGAEKARLQQEYDARQRAFEEQRMAREQELRSQQQALAAQQQAFLAEQQKLATERARLDTMNQQFNSEREKFAAEKAAYDAQMQALNAMQAAMRDRENELNKRQALDAIEKEFADKANEIDGFIVAESNKVVSATTLETLDPIQRFGVDHGQGMLDKLRECGMRAMELGLQQNRFTKHTLKSLEERWANFKRQLDERSRSLIPSQYPAPPSQYGAFQGPTQSQYGAGPMSAPPPIGAQYPSAPVPGLGNPNQYAPVPSLGTPQQARPPPQQQYPQAPPPQYPPQQQQYPQQQYPQQPPRPQVSVTHIHHVNHPAPAPVYPTVITAPAYPVVGSAVYGAPSVYGVYPGGGY